MDLDLNWIWSTDLAQNLLWSTLYLSIIFWTKSRDLEHCVSDKIKFLFCFNKQFRISQLVTRHHGFHWRYFFNFEFFAFDMSILSLILRLRFHYFDKLISHKIRDILWNHHIRQILLWSYIRFLMTWISNPR